mmetsp:Transcript_30530/g.39370  ORF Transcript_30530/g.39370 Transcript_30530/m.39370 type:complete len:112 (-) Transcript_30530:158-493(-)
MEYLESSRCTADRSLFWVKHTDTGVVYHLPYVDDIVAGDDNLSQSMSNPDAQHWKALKIVLKYIKGTLDYGLSFERNSGSPSVNITGFLDFARDIGSRKSYTRFNFSWINH